MNLSAADRFSDSQLPTADDYSASIETKFITLIERESGIVMDNIKRKEIKQTLTACMEVIGEISFNRYYARLKAGAGEGGELKKLINFITINETFFFRIPEHFDILNREILPDITRRKAGGRIAVWSAGSSSGEEVYSLIISMLEYPGLAAAFKPDVLGTDINDEMLYLARKGIYSGRTLNKVPDYLLRRYFEPFSTDRYRVNDEVRSHAAFSYLNLAHPFNIDFFGKLDVIFFRNVLIYFNIETTRVIIEAFYHLLNDGGYLVLGPSETLWDISDKFELLMFENAFVYKKKSKEQLAAAVPPPPRTSPPTFQFPPSSSPSPSSSSAPVETIIPSPPPVPKPKPVTKFFPSITDRIRIKLNEASLAIELADYGKAEKLLAEILMVDAVNKHAMLLRVTLFCNQDQEEPLFEYVEQVRQIYPVFPELHYLIARFHESRRNIKEALKEYNTILFINQGYLLARERLMHLYRDTGDDDQAKREARNIIELVSTDSFKPFDYPVGDAVNTERLHKACTRVLY